MKQKLIRPTAALFPIAGISGILVGNHSSVMVVFVSYYLIQVFSLCAAECFRNAAAQEPGVHRVDRRFSGSFLPLIAGILITGLVWQLVLIPLWRTRTWHSGYTAAALICIEHLFEERMYALGRRIDGIILSCITGGLLIAGFMLGGGSATNPGIYLIIATGIGAVISIAASYGIEPIHGFSLKPDNIRFITSAAPQTLLYVLIATIATTVTRARILDMMMPLLFGLIPWRLARTTCRRTQDESRGINLFLILFAAIPTAVSTLLPIAQSFALTAYVALVCAAIVFCAPSERFFAGIVLIAIAFVTPPVISIILALAAVIINLNKAFLKKV